MAQAAVIDKTTHRGRVRQSGQAKSKTKLSKSVKPTSSFTGVRIANDRCQDEVLTQLAGQIIREYKPVTINLTVDSIDAEHFAALMELGVELGLQDEVEAVLSETTALIDLTELTTQITNSLIATVCKESEQEIQSMVSALVKLLTDNGHQVNEKTLSQLHQCFMNSELTNLEIGVNRSENNNFEDSMKVSLSLGSEECSMYALRNTENPFWLAVQNAVVGKAHEGLLRGDFEDLSYYTGYYYESWDEISKIITEQNPDKAKIIELLEEDEEAWFTYGIEYGNDDEFQEAADSLISLGKPFVQYESNYLSEWFEQQFTTFDGDMYDRVSYGYPAHFITSSSELIESMNVQIDAIMEDADSRLILNPHTAKQALTTIMKNQAVVCLYDALTYLGYEQDELKPTYLTKNNITETSPEKIFE